MRSTLAIATVTAFAATVSASNCNPSYNVTGSGTCFTNCNTQAGQTYVSGWTMDPTSPLFLPSLKLMCTKGTSEYLAFMTTAGICMAKCPDDPTLFNNEFAGACSWYALHANDTCADASGSPSSSASSSTSSTSGASKLAISGYAAVLVAGAAYLGF